MIYLLITLHLGWVVREVLVDGEIERERAGFVHAFVRLDGQGKMQDVVGVGEGHFHGGAEGEFGEVWSGLVRYGIGGIGGLCR